MQMVFHSLRRNFYLYGRIMGQNLRAVLEYQSDFLLSVGSAMLTQVLGLVFLSVIFARIPAINGWGFWQVVLIYASIFLTEGFASLFFEGTWRISWFVNHGELDRILLRPMSPAVQVLSSAIGMNGIGNLLVGAVMVGESLAHVHLVWSTGKILFTIILLLSGIVIRTSINFASNCSAFWVKNAGNAVPFMVHSISEFAKYPLTIYVPALQALVGIVVPYAFIGYVPAAYIFSSSGMSWVAALCPVVALYCVGMAAFIFRVGLRQYESTGN